MVKIEDWTKIYDRIAREEEELEAAVAAIAKDEEF